MILVAAPQRNLGYARARAELPLLLTFTSDDMSKSRPYVFSSQISRS